jgi:predicted metal-dependent enzyme (double-stranded beta helix superfamily)
VSVPYEFKQLEADIDTILKQTSHFRGIIEEVRPFLQKLLTNENLLPVEYQKPLPNKYAQYLLYKPDNESFSVIAFVWGPGQVAPVHDHLVWGLVGLYQGSVIEKRYRRVEHGEAAEPKYSIHEISEITANKGDISFVYPPDHDIHSVSNPFEDIAITIHIYGTDIGKQERHIHDVSTGNSRDVITKHDNLVPIYS